MDEDLLEKADMLPGEQVHVLNINNGLRFITYTIAAPRGTRKVILNGPAARLGNVGDKIIILSYCKAGEQEAKNLHIKTVMVNDNKDFGEN